MANDAPTLSDLVASDTFGENLVNATPQLIDASVTFTDPNNNYTGGHLTVTGLLAEDRIAVRNQGLAGGQIGVSGSNISYSGTTIGSFTGGTGNSFDITFNANATATAIDALIQNLTYGNVSDTPTADRTLTLDVVDAGGAHLSGFSSFSSVSGASSPVNNLTRGTNDFLIHVGFNDIDGDGDLDAFYSSYNTSFLATYRNNGNGTFTSITNPLATDITYGAVAFLDIDGDGDLDAVSAYGQVVGFRTFQRQANNTFVELTGGSNPFANADPTHAYGGFTSPAAVDVDGDGRTDMVWTSGSGEVFYYHHNANNTFTNLTGASNPFDAIHLASGFTIKAVTFADVDGDGDPDMVAANGTTLLYYRNNAGTFTQQTGAFDSQGNGNPFNGVTGEGPLTPVFADFDGDGDSELVVGQGSTHDANNVQLPYLFFQNSGTFGRKIAIHVNAESDNNPPAVNHNTGLTLNEGATGTITVTQLDFNDAEQADTAITYTITAAVTHGAVKLSGSTLGLNGTFTQDDLDNNRVTYVHDGGETTSDSFGFSVSDGAGGSVTGQTFAFTVTPQNDAPAVNHNTGLTLNEGATGTITATQLDFDDPDTADTAITYTVTSATTHGAVKLSGTTLGVNSTFTQDDLDNNRVTYVHDGGETTSDSFGFSVSDGVAAPITGQTFAFTVTPQNDAPTVNHNTGLTLNEGATATITATQLDFDDVEQADTAITYTVTSAATNGTLRLSGSTVGLNGTFTQDDLDNNRVTFVHDGSETTSASFGFSVSDGAGGSVTGQTFAFTVTPLNDAPVFGASTFAMTLVSTTGAGALGDGDSEMGNFSPDGTHIAFASGATNLVAGDTNARIDIFLKDLVTGTVTLLSSTSAGAQGTGGTNTFPVGGWAPTFGPEGTQIAFSSNLNGLVAGDAANEDIFVKTLTNNSTFGIGGSGTTAEPIFSPDGGRLLFVSNATNLVAGDTNAAYDVFVTDGATLTRVSTTSAGAQGNAISQNPSWSPDGTKVIFGSSASNLVTGDTNTFSDVFIKDLNTGAVTRISTDSNGNQATGGASTFGYFSPDGTKVAFTSGATNLVTGDTNAKDDLFVKDLATGAVTRVSTDSNGNQSTGSTGLGVPQWSPDSTKLIFASDATNLVAGDTNGAYDVFVKDLVTGTTTRISTDASGGQQNGTLTNGRVYFSPDGTQVVFYSNATNLVAGDTNAKYDIFVASLASSESTIFTENGTARIIAPYVTASDADSANYAAGTLTVAVTGNAVAGDAIGLFTSANPNFGLTLSGTDVKYNGVTVGTLSTGTASLSVALNSNATDTAVKAIAGAATFSSTSDNPTNATRTVTFTLQDGGGTTGGGADTTSFTRDIHVTAQNDAPAVSHNTGLTLNEGATGTITATQLDFDDADNADTAIVYTLTSTTTHGAVKLSGSTLGVNGTFTQDDLDNNRVTYVHDGGETTSDSFGFSVSDGAGGSVTGQTFAFTVTPQNDAPTQNHNTGLTLNEGASATITATQLDFDDADNADTAIVYTVTATTEHGGLQLNGTTLGLNATFTQDDLDNNLVTYVHDGGETTSDFFGFSVSDGVAAPITGQTFGLAVTPVNDAPVLNGLGTPTLAWDQSTLDLSNETNGSAVVVASDFVLAGSTTMFGFNAWAADNATNDDGVFSSFGGTLGWAIYADTSSAPGALLYRGQDSSVQVSDAGVQDVFGCDVFRLGVDFAAPITLAAGTYWLALHEGAWGSGSDGSPIWLSYSPQIGTVRKISSDVVNPTVWADGNPASDNAFTLLQADSAPSVTFAENTVNATPQIIDGDVSFGDSEGNLNGGTIVVGGLLAEDRVAIRNQGNTAGLIGTSGSNVTYGGTTIGTFAGGNGGSFTVTLNGSATLAAVDALIQNLTYADVSDTPTASRALTITATDGGGASGAGTITINVTAQSEAPTVNHNTGLTLDEGATGTITATQLDFDDAEQSDTAIVYTVTSAATHGAVKLSGSALGVNDTFTQDDLDNNRVTYAHDGGETTSDSFGFSVSDGAGGTATGQTFAFTVTPVNDAPSGTNVTKAFAQDTIYTFDLTDFGFSDAEGDGFDAVTITTLPTAGGFFFYDGSGPPSAVTAGQSISAADIDAGALYYIPDFGAHGTSYASFTFQVQDDGGTANGGADLDASPNTFTFDVLDNPPELSNPDTVIVQSGAAPIDLRIAAPDDDEPVTITLDSVPTYGTVEYFQGGNWVVAVGGETLTDDELRSLRYTPPATGEFGGESIAYSASDGVETTMGSIAVSSHVANTDPALLLVSASPTVGGNPNLYTVDAAGTLGAAIPGVQFAGQNGGFFQFNGLTYFSASGGPASFGGLFQMTSDGTVSLVDADGSGGYFGNGNGEKLHFTIFNGSLYFDGEAPGQGDSLIQLNTDGTSTAYDLNPGFQNSAGANGGFVAFDGSLFFSAVTTLTNGSGNPDLIRLDTDGTLSEITTRDAGLEANGSFAGEDGGFIVFNNALYFNAYNDTYGETLFRLDAGATAAGVVDPGMPHYNGVNSAFHVFAGQLLFNEGGELLTIDEDGNLSGIDYLNSASNYEPLIDAGSLGGFFDYAGATYFVATTSDTGTDLFKLDNCGCLTAIDLNPTGDAFDPNLLSGFTVFDGALYVTAYDGGGGNSDSLFRIDAQGNVSVAYSNGGTTLAGVEGGFQQLGGSLYFSAYTADGYELVKLNADGSYTDYDINPGVSANSFGSQYGTLGLLNGNPMVGTAGDDLMVGSTGTESIDGGAGHDLFDGRGGNDNLTGGDNADLFVLSLTGAANVVTIADYTLLDPFGTLYEGDEIDLSALLDAGFVSGSHIEDFVRVIADGGDLKLQVDVDGTGTGAVWTDAAILTGKNDPGVADSVKVHFDGETEVISELDQSNLHTTALVGGGWVVTWTQSAFQDGPFADTYPAVFARLYDAGGNPTGESFLVSDPQSRMPDDNSIVTALPNGNFAVTWEDCLDQIQTRVYDSTGGDVSGGPQFVLDTPDYTRALEQVVGLANGNYAILSTYVDTFANSAIYATIYDQSGQPVTLGSIEVNTPTSGVSVTLEANSLGTLQGLDQASIVPLANGFAVTWQAIGEDDGGGNFHNNIYVRVFGNDGTPTTAAIQVNGPEDVAAEIHNEIAATGGDNFVVSWERQGNDGTDQVYTRLFDSADYTLGAGVRADATPADGSILARPEQVTGLANGGYVTMWRETGPGASDILVQTYDSAGAMASGSSAGGVVVNALAGAGGTPREVTALAGGGFAVLYQAARHDSVGGGTDLDAFVRVFGADGAPVSGEIQLNAPDVANNLAVQLIALADGSFVAAWGAFESTANGGRTDVMAQIFAADGAAIGSPTQIGATESGSDSADELSGVQEFRAAAAAGSGAGFLAALISSDFLNNNYVDAFHGVSAVSAVFAQADAVATDEATAITGASVFADNGSGVDFGATLTVTEVNGSASAVGNQITLDSGALLTLNADGTFSYDPNGQYTYLTTPGSGAKDNSATDSFTYTLQNGGIATVTVTISGVVSAGDELWGDANDNTITGTNGSDFFNMSQGGTDTGIGGGGSDGFYFSGGLDITDNIDGGTNPGTDDQVGLQGNFTYTFGPNNLVNIETLAIISGHDTRFHDTSGSDYSYNLTTVNANVAAGATLTVNANNLAAGENLTFNGSAETDGKFFFYAGLGTDSLTGGQQNDGFFFGDSGRFSPTDHVDGQGGTDDQLGIRGDYSALTTFSATSMVNVETLALLSASDSRFAPPGSAYDYNLKLDDANVASGSMLTVSGNNLRADESMAIDGSAETNGWFRFYAGAGDDTLIGGTGDDRFTGGLGKDAMTGNDGNDTFYFRTTAESAVGANADQITDFTVGDHIDVSAIDADTVTSGTQAFTFLDTGAFTNHAGEARITGAGANWTLQVDTDGDGNADMEIAITTTGGHTPVASDFIL